ncbi:MAG: hypothetical protein H3C43_02190 [Leptonema sp. (in: Bacteria)]|nr:hypothetical protein [Leptonema sp. (in: bacteria)]
MIHKLNRLPIFLLVTILSVCSVETNSTPEAAPNQNRPHFVNTEATIVPDQNLNDTARLMAGLSLDDTANQELKAIDQSASFKTHKDSLGASFSKAEQKRLTIMKDWSTKELADICKQKNDLFYPFSGPDIMTAHAIFPCAKDYIMIGLEPAGVPPRLQKMNEVARARYFAAIRNSLGSILSFSFFRTNDMRDDFQGVLDGLTPILMVFLAREGNEIIAAKAVTLMADKSVVERDHNTPATEQENKTGIPGIRFYFKDAKEKNIKTVTYFSVDISDSGLANRGYFLDAIAATGSYTTYLKSASYLMHRDSFSKIRSFILENSDHVVEDDSGIPLSFFSEANWQRSFYGMYTKPIPLFSARYQSDLRAIYKEPKKNNIKPLPFGTGYNYQEGDSHLLVARKNKVKSSSK